MPDITPTDTEGFVSADGQDVKPLADILREFRRGTWHRDASIAFHELLAAVVATEKKGELNLKLTVSTSGDLQVELKADHQLKLPRPAPPAQHYFVDRAGNPTRHDPYQAALPGTTDDLD